MRQEIYRNYRSIEGILNNIIHYFGVKNMCRCKKWLGWIGKIQKKKTNLQQLKIWSKQHPEIPDAHIWEDNFTLLIKESNEIFMMEIIEEFYTCNLKQIKDIDTNKSKITSIDPVVLCVEKNEILRMPEFLNHYRNLGVKKFLILDNGSTDGTKEYLLQQSDVRLYETYKKYNARRKSAWQNRMVADNGQNHWYLYVDADEFIWYPEISRISLPDYVKKLKQKGRGVFAAKAIMLEMYPKGIIGDDSISVEKFREEYCYFDKDSNDYCYNPDRNLVKGGFMNRVFGEKSEILQCKIPLYFSEKGRFIIGSHHIFPLYEDIASDYSMILQHYKFLPGDKAKIQEAIKNENYANGSYWYKRYINLFETEDGVSVYFQGSIKWDNEKIMNEFSIIRCLDEMHSTM